MSAPTTAPGTTTEHVAALRSLVVDCPDLPLLEQRLSKFNLFDVLKSAHSEIRHSNVLAWLLQPGASHGLQEKFLRRFLMQVLHSANLPSGGIDPIEIDAARFNSVEVRREWRNIDVLVHLLVAGGDEWVFCIENKVHATESAGQLAKYHAVVTREFPLARQLFIFLTIDGFAASDGRYVTARYEQVLGTLRGCMAEAGSALGPGPRHLMDDYCEILEERFMDNSDVARLARKIYAAHRQAIDLILAHRPDHLLEVTDELIAMVETEAAALSLRPIQSGKGLIRFVPSSWWAVPQSRRGENWSAVFCELWLLGKTAYFKAVVGPDVPGEWRKLVFDTSARRGYPNTHRKNSIPEKWLSYYIAVSRISIVPDKDLTPAEHARSIWTWCKQHLAEPSYQGMVTDLVPLLKQLPASTRGAPASREPATALSP